MPRHAACPRFVDNLKCPHQQMWLPSKGQIDFYDDARLIGMVCDAIAAFMAQMLEARHRKSEEEREGGSD